MNLRLVFLKTCNALVRDQSISNKSRLHCIDIIANHCTSWRTSVTLSKKVQRMDGILSILIHQWILSLVISGS